MNMMQIKYFITAAKCLNFTKAADQLFITQPALSRQIFMMESELNLQLFIRTNRTVRLTPAAQILLIELDKIYKNYNDAVEKAHNAQYGLTGQLNIGILDGTKIDELFPETMQKLAELHPNIVIDMRNYSFNGLIERLYDGRLDLALTLYFDIAERSNLMFKIIRESKDYVVVPATHRLADKDKVNLIDFQDDTFIIVRYEDSETSANLIINACKKQGFMPKVRFSPSIQTSMLWVLAGVGVSIFDSCNELYENKKVKFLNVDTISDPSLTLVWHQDNFNPAREIFTKIFLN